MMARLASINRLNRLGETVAANWVHLHPDTYIVGVLDGFEAEPEQDQPEPEGCSGTTE